MKYFVETRWNALWKRLEAKSIPAFSIVAAAYAEPQRRYHTAAHIEALLAYFEAYSWMSSDPDVVEMAIWMHDIVYDVSRSDNEEKSAEFTDALMSFHGCDLYVHRVREIILATKGHHPDGNANVSLMLDIDLSILGQSWEAYSIYAAQIRQEFSWAPDSAFRAGRKSVLKSMIKRKHFYSLPFFRDRWETQARLNIQREIDSLT